MKRYFSLLTLLLGAVTCFAQLPTDIEKLANACRAWGFIKYFHPNQPSYTFDSAFAAQVPAMLKAHDDDAWQQALQDWLAVLNDPVTMVMRVSPDSSSTFATPPAYHKEVTADSILLVSIDGAHFFNDFLTSRDFLTSALEEAKQTRKVIFDLRQTTEIPLDYQDIFSLHFDYFGLNQTLATNPSPPQYRSLYYSGFVPERGATSGGYSREALLTNLPHSSSVPSQEITTVWITNQHSQLPDIAIAEQAVGRAYIVHDSDDLHPLLPIATSFPFANNYHIRFRNRDIRTTNQVVPTADTVYRDNGNALAMAQDLLSTLPSRSAGSTSAATIAVEPERKYPEDKLPDVGYRVLAAAKIFTVIEHFFPYHQYMDRDWNEVLVESLPDFIAANDTLAYGKAVARMYANVQDSHGFIAGNAIRDALYGDAPPPLPGGLGGK